MVTTGPRADPRVLAVRNTAVFAASVATLTVVMLYPTSMNSGTHRGPGQRPARPGVVVPSPSPDAEVVINGGSVDTAYGPVQVQLRIRAGRIQAATAIVYPQGTGRDVQINNYAIPQLEQETVAAQSARIDTVSGATYTSEGYLTSLQSALDLAHLA